MTRWCSLFLLALAACSGDGGSSGGDDDDSTAVGDDDDDDASAYPPVESLQEKDDRFCEDAKYYNPDVPTASAQWFSELTIDSEGVVEGYEMAKLYPNDRLVETSGFTDCVVIWNVLGVVDDPKVGGTDLGLLVDLQLNVVDTTCDPNPFEEFVSSTVHYNVAVSGGTSSFYFDSGTLFAAGYGGDSYLSWFFDECKLF